MKKIRKPKPWKHTQPITKAELVKMREEFWDTAPHYGGTKGKIDSLLISIPCLVCVFFLVVWFHFIQKKMKCFLGLVLAFVEKEKKKIVRVCRKEVVLVIRRDEK